MGANLLFLSPKPGLCRIDDFVPDTYVAVLSQYYEKISQFLLTQALFAGILRTFSIDLSASSLTHIYVRRNTGMQ